MEPLQIKRPTCHSAVLQSHTTYPTQHHGRRIIYQCTNCPTYFSETKKTLMAGLKTPVSVIWQVVKARTEGMGLNAAARTFEKAKNTILAWERKFRDLHQVLFLYAVVHEFLALVIEGDEAYTKVQKNVPPDQSSGWTILLVDRASRFIWELDCGKKDRRLFQKAIKTLDKIARQTLRSEYLTDGERRYGNLLFEICYDLVNNGKPGRPKKTFQEECTSESRIKVHKRIKKVESAPNIRAHGRNILRQLVPLGRLTSMPIMPKLPSSCTAPQVCHLSKKDQYVCQSNHRIAEAVTSILGGAQFSSCSFYHLRSSRCRFGHPLRGG